MTANLSGGPRFRIDDHVYFAESGGPGRGAVAAARYVIVAVMPKDITGSHQYRIKPTDAGPHRLVRELELRR
jgi:hypothetical protein